MRQDPLGEIMVVLTPKEDRDLYEKGPAGFALGGRILENG